MPLIPLSYIAQSSNMFYHTNQNDDRGQLAHIFNRRNQRIAGEGNIMLLISVESRI